MMARLLVDVCIAVEIYPAIKGVDHDHHDIYKINLTYALPTMKFIGFAGGFILKWDIFNPQKWRKVVNKGIVL